MSTNFSKCTLRMEGGKEAEKKLNEGAEKKRKIAKIIKE
jgi:hypothetical protein